jgi:hypothetical protein
MDYIIKLSLNKKIYKRRKKRLEIKAKKIAFLKIFEQNFKDNNLINFMFIEYLLK